MSSKEMKQATRIRRGRDDVWAALTDARGLEQWLANEATVDLRPDGAFSLTSAIPYITGNHRVVRFEPGVGIEVEWIIQETATRVIWALEDADGDTWLAVTHRFPADVPFQVDDVMGNDCGEFHEMWAYTCGLLRTYLELGAAQPRLAIDRTPEKQVTHEVKLKAAPERVFLALVEPTDIKAWNPFAGDVVVDQREGGRYSFGWPMEEQKTDGPDEIVEFRDGRKISYRWFGDPPTLVSWEIEPINDDSTYSTRLRMTHSGFIQDQNMLVGYNLGWGGFLQAIALWIDAGVPAAGHLEYRDAPPEWAANG